MPETVAIVGAGPVGLAAAAHALERGLKPLVLEAGPNVGHAVRRSGHARMFSAWEHNIDKAAARLLEQAGWSRPEPTAYPTGAELVERYLQPLAAHTILGRHIRTGAHVAAVARAGFDKVRTAGRDQAPFELRIAGGRSDALRADAVIDASGTWASPNPAGATYFRPSGRLRTPTASPTACRMSWGASAPATPERQWPCSAPGTPPSVP